MHYLIPLIFTLFVELFVVFLLGFRDKKLFLLIFAVNILTNPLLNFIVYTYIFTFAEIILMELIVVVIEGAFLKYTHKGNLPYYKLAFVMNATSFLIGIWLPWQLIERLY